MSRVPPHGLCEVKGCSRFIDYHIVRGKAFIGDRVVALDDSFVCAEHRDGWETTGRVLRCYLHTSASQPRGMYAITWPGAPLEPVRTVAYAYDDSHPMVVQVGFSPSNSGDQFWIAPPPCPSDNGRILLRVNDSVFHQVSARRALRPPAGMKELDSLLVENGYQADPGPIIEVRSANPEAEILRLGAALEEIAKR